MNNLEKKGIKEMLELAGVDVTQGKARMLVEQDLDNEVAKNLISKDVKIKTEKDFIRAMSNELKAMKLSPNLINDNDFISDTMSSYKHLGGEFEPAPVIKR